LGGKYNSYCESLACSLFLVLFQVVTSLSIQEKMRSITAIILSAFVVQAHANDEQLTEEKLIEMLNDKDTMDKVVEKLADKLFGQALFTAPRAPTVPYQYSMPAETRPLMRDASLSGRFGSSLDVAPPLINVEYKLPDALNPNKKDKTSNNAKQKVWGNPYGDGGSTPSEPYGNVYPTVGESFPRDKPYNDNSKGQSYYVPGSKDALFGNEKYELLKNGIKAEVTQATDQTKEARAARGTFVLQKNPGLYEEQTDVISTYAMGLIGLVVGSGVTLAVVRFRRNALTMGKEPLLGA
jgi:hypothetical protein